MWLLVAGICLPGRAALWVSGYFPDWEQDQMPASAIDFSVVTHVIHYSIIPLSDGTLDIGANGLTASK